MSTSLPSGVYPTKDWIASKASLGEGNAIWVPAYWLLLCWRASSSMRSWSNLCWASCWGASLLFVVERRLLFVFFVGLPALVGAVLGLPGVELPFVVDDVRLPLVFGLRPVVVQSVCCWRFPFVCPVVG